MHSHTYRKPEGFKDSTVVVVGARPSGMDIMLDLSTEANKIYLSHRQARVPGELPSNMIQVSAIQGIQGNAVEFTDGELFDSVDYIMLCTGIRIFTPVS